MLAGIDAFNASFLASLSNIESRVAVDTQQLSSGIRVNEASDDPAAIASILTNQNQIDQLTQVQTNLNQAGVVASSADGALASASTLLDQLTSIAAEGSSSTSSTSLTELAAQVQTIGHQLVALANTSVLGQYIFGGNASGTQPYNDLAAWSSGVDIATNTQSLDKPAAVFLATAGATQNFQFNVYANGSAQTVTATVTGAAGGITSAQALAQLNTQLNPVGITAGTDHNGLLQFSGSAAFNVEDLGASAGTGISNATPAAASATSNTSNYIVSGQATYSSAAGDTLQFQTNAGQATVVLAPNTSLSSAIVAINAKTAQDGVYAVPNAAGTGIDLQSTKNFSVTSLATGTFSGAGGNTAAAPLSGGPSQNNTSANTVTLQNGAGSGIVPGMTAQQIFDTQTTGTPPAPAAGNLLQNTYALWQALQSGSISNVQTAASNLQLSVPQLGQAATFYGTTENWITASTQSAASTVVNLTENLSSLRDADVAQAATNLSLDQTALQAALEGHASLNLKSLFDYM
jgi:flagellar hook-associated protein 3